MPAERFEIRISLSKLLIGLLLTVIPISIAGLYSLSISDKSLERTIGSHFQTIAQSTAAEVSQFIHDRVASVGVLAVDPTLVDTILAANRSYQGTDPAAKIQKTEAAWYTPAVEPLVNRILSSPASRLLRRFRELDQRFLRITVTDEEGATVAATHKTLDYFQADEDFWQAIYAQGRGAINITDVLHDEVTKSNYIGVGVPVLEEGSHRFIGAVDALVDVSSLSPIMHRLQIGPSARTLLVKEDGTVISGPQVNLAMRVKSEELAAMQDALRDWRSRGTGYVVADVKGGSRSMIGFADTGLKQDYGNLGWIVVISQDAREAFAPIRAAGRLLAFMSLMGLVSVTLLAMYFVLHRKQPFAEIEELRPSPPAKAARA